MYVCMYFVCYQNKQDAMAGEYFPVSNRTNTFDIVQPVQLVLPKKTLFKSPCQEESRETYNSGTLLCNKGC